MADVDWAFGWLTRESYTTTNFDDLVKNLENIPELFDLVSDPGETVNRFTEKGAVAEAASDFDALEHLRRLAFSDRVREPEQLKLWT